MLRFLAILPIKFYQKYISPKKGFRCAHSVKNGGTGCSGAVIQIIETASVFNWSKLIKKRFADCKQASEDLKKEKKKYTEKCKKCKPSSKDCNGCADVSCDAADCGDCGDFGSCS